MDKKLVDEYLEYHHDLIKKYGPKSVVLLQNGSFYEIYNYRVKTGPDIYAFADLLNIQVSRRDKKNPEVSRSNYEMAGFPTWSKQKFFQLLLNYGYTVAIYNQDINGKKNVDRSLEQIISPGMNLDYANGLDNNYCMSIYIETYKNALDYFYILSYSIIDLTTGSNFLFECSSRPNDFQYGIDQIYHVIKIYNPKEIIINIIDKHNIFNEKQLINDLEINIEHRVYHYHLNEISNDYQKLSFQNAFLGKVFPHNTKMTAIEYLDLEKYPNAIISYIILLEFAKNHRTNIIERISKPQLLECDDNLILTHNSIQQLNIIPDKNAEYNYKNSSLLTLINNCSTAIGRRLFKHNLLNPTRNVDKLNKSYENIENFLEIYEDNQKYKLIEPILQKILDIERLHRKLSLKIINPNEFNNLDTSYTYIYELVNKLNEINLQILIPNENVLNQFNEFILYYQSKFNMDEIYKYNDNKSIERSIFKKGIFDDIDKIDDELQYYQCCFKLLGNKLSKIVDSSKDDCINLEYNDKDGYFFNTTIKRMTILKQNIKNMKDGIINISINDDNIKIDLNQFKYKEQTTVCKINSKEFKKWNDNFKLATQKMKYYSEHHYKEILESLFQKYKDMFKELVKFIGETDVLKTHAKNAINFNLSKPIIDQNHSNSYLEAKGLRHIIVEQIQTKTAYVSNDIYLGKDDQYSILCYGFNSVGKTTLQKSICLSIIMAQCGGFVSANYFKFQPYQYIFTRISNVDNIHKSQSSYEVEMAELRYIMKHVNKNSLVVIDELVSSTERHSGFSLVCSTLITLDRLNCSVFMATHIHELSQFYRIKELGKLKIYHLEVHFDEGKQKLIFYRKLKDGSGTGLYGLEVAQSFNFDKEFINLAFEIRNEILEKDAIILDHKKSNFNADIYVHNCQICDNKNEILHTHHINFQCCADNDGNFKNLGFHKNIEHNLVVLCQKCHKDVHKEKYIINGYLATSNGYELDYKLNDKKEIDSEKTQMIKKRIKLTDDVLITLKNIFNNEFNNFKNKKDFLSYLEKKHNYKVDYKTLKKIETI